MSAGMSGGSIDERVGQRFRDESGRGVDPEHRLVELVRQEAPLLSDEHVRRRARRLAIDLVGLGALQHLLDDVTVTDVLVNGPGEVWVERCGRLERTGSVVSREAIDRCIERLVGPLGIQADRTHPIVDARLDDGSRVTVVLPPLAVDGPVLAIRRHRAVDLPLSAFGGAELVTLLEQAVVDRQNVVVFGPTGSGKTTLLNSLAAVLPSWERVVTIEDVAELRLPGEHVVRLEARPGSAEGVGRVAIRDLVRAALRLRPDRIVVGEVRGAEALDMVWALSTGHKGSMSTCHADSATDVLRRIETLALSAGEGLVVESVRAQVLSAVDLLVGVERQAGGARGVSSIHAVADGRLVRLDGPG